MKRSINILLLTTLVTTLHRDIHIRKGYYSTNHNVYLGLAVHEVQISQPPANYDGIGDKSQNELTISIKQN